MCMPNKSTNHLSKSHIMHTLPVHPPAAASNPSYSISPMLKERKQPRPAVRCRTNTHRARTHPSLPVMPTTKVSQS